MSRSTVTLASTLVIHPSIKLPDVCAVCAMWNDFTTQQPIIHPAEFFGQWDDQNGPDNYIGLCAGCVSSGFTYIGTLDEFKAAQLRAVKHEYEVYGNDRARTHYECANRADVCARIRVMIAHGISIDAIYQRVGGRLVKLNRDDQARIVIEAMES